MQTITETYEKQWVEVICKYQCTCGHKFTRRNRDWFTMNPFVSEPFHVVRERYLIEMKKLERECPKCKLKLKPIPILRSNHVLNADSTRKALGSNL
jgi:hypothetical protein